MRNISRGGVLLCVTGESAGVANVEQCVLRFRGIAGDLRPSVARGTVRRRDRSGPALYLAIEFSEPLVSLSD